MVRCGTYEERRGYLPDEYYYHQSRPIPIMGRGRASVDQLIQFFSATRKQFDYRYVQNVARTFVQESNIEGVNSDVAFCQMCIETNYLRFGGQVQQSQNNFCGLGATDGGSRGESFESIRLGVRAHIQHLKAYASTKPLNRKTVDPRFDRVKRGSIVTVQDLAGTWATDPQYGHKIAQKLYELNQYF
ncbi:glucosaminidase domain-containing protein [bacterium]|nr:glucosaminidase domain-containing protein [bacterium]RQV96051.1 MAG: glucosaminidase [bacterium]